MKKNPKICEKCEKSLSFTFLYNGDIRCLLDVDDDIENLFKRVDEINKDCPYKLEHMVLCDE